MTKITMGLKALHSFDDNMATVYELRDELKAAGYFGENNIEVVKDKWELAETRKLMGRISVLIETDEGAERMRRVGNAQIEKDGEIVNVYFDIPTAPQDMQLVVAQQYIATGKVYVRIGNALMDVATRQIMLFDINDV